METVFVVNKKRNLREKYTKSPGISSKELLQKRKEINKKYTFKNIRSKSRRAPNKKTPKARQSEDGGSTTK